MLQDMLKRIKREEGFTLVELLIVVAIIAILAAIAIPQFSKYRTRAFVTELNSDLKNAYTAAQAYLTDNPGGTVDSLAKLQLGGYNASANITVDTTDTAMTLSAGNVTLESSSAALNTAASNNASVTFNGVFTQATNP